MAGSCGCACLTPLSLKWAECRLFKTRLKQLVFADFSYSH